MRRIAYIRLLPLLAVAACALALPAGAAAQSGPQAANPAQPNPLEGLDFFVDKSQWSVQNNQYRSYLRRGQSGSAALVGEIALQPQFKWFGRWNARQRGGTTSVIRRYLERVQEEQPGSVPQMAILRHQGKACYPGYSAGGTAEDRRTRDWYEDFARGVGDSRVVIGFEPDSLGTIECLTPSRRRSRLVNMRHGIDVLSKLPNATIYIEAGASDWESATRTARQLRFVGVSKVRGFMLNVTHYDWTANNIRHGLDISRRVGGKHFIISTSFNGRGPVHYKRWLNRRNNIWRIANVWCHPLKRGLGIPPTTRTHSAKADGYFYIGRPGYSGGSCNGGPLPIGSWWPKRALMFAKNSTTWLRPPRGYGYGWPKGPGLRAYAGDQIKR